MKKETQIEKLASFIMNEVDGEPSQSEGAGDCAIRIIKTLKATAGEYDKGYTKGWVEGFNSGAEEKKEPTENRLSADEFINSKLGDKDYTHSPYPMFRNDIVEWIEQYVKQCNPTEEGSGAEEYLNDPKYLHSGHNKLTQNVQKKNSCSAPINRLFGPCKYNKGVCTCNDVCFYQNYFSTI